MNVTNPRAQIPGYCGYIPGKNSQNKFGASFGQLTKGAYENNKDAFLTTNISNNQALKKQYPSGDKFWSNEKHINVLESSSGKQEGFKHKNTKAIHINYKPQKTTDLTYQQAIHKKI